MYAHPFGKTPMLIQVAKDTVNILTFCEEGRRGHRRHNYFYFMQEGEFLCADF
jgi:hypothetical protein